MLENDLRLKGQMVYRGNRQVYAVKGLHGQGLRGVVGNMCRFFVFGFRRVLLIPVARTSGVVFLRLV